MRFTWDPAKEATNQVAHGVDFTTAQIAFNDPRSLVVFDAAHSDKRELRWWLLGKVDTRIGPVDSCESSARDTGGKERNFMKTTGKKTAKPRFDQDGYQTNLDSLNGESLPQIDPKSLRPLRGGARPGAGRKPSGKVPVLLRLTPATAKHLRTVAKKSKRTLSEVAEQQLAGLR